MSLLFPHPQRSTSLHTQKRLEMERGSAFSETASPPTTPPHQSDTPVKYASPLSHPITAEIMQQLNQSLAKYNNREISGPQAVRDFTSILYPGDLKATDSTQRDATLDTFVALVYTKGSDIVLGGSVVKRTRNDKESPSASKRMKSEFMDLPWVGDEQIIASAPNPSLLKNRSLLELYARDYAFVKRQILLSSQAPRSIPESGWDAIIRGKYVELDVFLDYSGTVASPDDWLYSWTLASSAIVFCFPHRKNELQRYEAHIRSYFRTKITSYHPRIIAYDRAVRIAACSTNQFLLDQFHHFDDIKISILEPGGRLFDSFASPPTGRTSVEKGICNRFNRDTCRYSATDCRYKHACNRCKRFGHRAGDCEDRIS